MGKKKKKADQKPWCFYCDRVFDDEAQLVQHQRSRHFKCPDCPKKLNTAQGLSTHAHTVHKNTISVVPNSKPGRESMELEIFGMAGVPEGLRPGGIEEEEPVKMPRLEGNAPPPPPASYPGAYGGSMRPPMMGGAPPYMHQQQQPPFMQQQQQAGPYGGYPMGMPPQHMGMPPQHIGMPPQPQPYNQMGMPPPYGHHPGFNLRPPGPVGNMMPQAGPPPPGPGPHGGPLFPIGSSGKAPEVSGPASSQAASASASAYVGDLIWDNEKHSIEEVRSRHPRYSGGLKAQQQQQQGPPAQAMPHPGIPPQFHPPGMALPPRMMPYGMPPPNWGMPPPQGHH